MLPVFSEAPEIERVAPPKPPKRAHSEVPPPPLPPPPEKARSTVRRGPLSAEEEAYSAPPPPDTCEADADCAVLECSVCYESGSSLECGHALCTKCAVRWGHEHAEAANAAPDNVFAESPSRTTARCSGVLRRHFYECRDSPSLRSRTTQAGAERAPGRSGALCITCPACRACALVAH